MLDRWADRFPGCEPAAHLLKEVFPTRWVRFHSLPGSKRYPGSETDYTTALGRQNRILAALIGDEPGVVLLTTEYSSPSRCIEISHDGSELRKFDPDAKPWRTVPMPGQSGDRDDPGTLHVLASKWTWRPGVFDPILRLVADDRIANVMIVPPDCRWIFHPYDGGMDVILESADRRDWLRSSFADWLSPRPDGL